MDVTVRHYNRSKDTPEALSKLNHFPEEVQQWLSKQYEFPFPEKNLIIAENGDGEIVGCLHIFDGGFPFALLEGFFLKEGYRTLKNALALGHFAQDELRARGVPVYLTYAPERLSKGLARYGLTATTPPSFVLMARRLED